MSLISLIRLCTVGMITHWSSRETRFSWWPWFTWLSLGCKKRKKKNRMTEWENWWGRTARETTWAPLYVHIYLSAWHCAVSVLCLRQKKMTHRLSSWSTKSFSAWRSHRTLRKQKIGAFIMSYTCWKQRKLIISSVGHFEKSCRLDHLNL